MYVEVWHGTNQEFDRFEERALGLHTQNDGSRQAFFFSAGPEVAWDYAQSASRKLVRNQMAHEETIADLLRQAGRAEKRRDFATSESLILKAEEMESAAMEDATPYETLLLCRIRLDNPFEVDASGVLIPVPDILTEARAAGHDGVILRHFWDTPTGVGVDDHYVVFDTEAIEILERHASLESVTDVSPSP